MAVTCALTAFHMRSLKRLPPSARILVSDQWLFYRQPSFLHSLL